MLKTSDRPSERPTIKVWPSSKPVCIIFSGSSNDVSPMLAEMRQQRKQLCPRKAGKLKPATRNLGAKRAVGAAIGVTSRKATLRTLTMSDVEPKQLTSVRHAVSVAYTTVCQTGEKAIWKGFPEEGNCCHNPSRNQRPARVKF